MFPGFYLHLISLAITSVFFFCTVVTIQRGVDNNTIILDRGLSFFELLIAMPKGTLRRIRFVDHIFAEAESIITEIVNILDVLRQCALICMWHMCYVSDEENTEQTLTQICPTGKRAYIGIFTQGRSKWSELLAALWWFTVLDGDLHTLRAVVNPVGTCLELANHLELKSAQKVGAGVRFGGVADCFLWLTVWLARENMFCALTMELSHTLIRWKIIKCCEHFNYKYLLIQAKSYTLIYSAPTQVMTHAVHFHQI